MTYPHSTITQDEYDALKVTLAARDAEIEQLRDALRGVLSWAEYIAGDGSNLTAHEVWEELHTIEMAHEALKLREAP